MPFFFFKNTLYIALLSAYVTKRRAEFLFLKRIDALIRFISLSLDLKLSLSIFRAFSIVSLPSAGVDRIVTKASLKLLPRTRYPSAIRLAACISKEFGCKSRISSSPPVLRRCERSSGLDSLRARFLWC